MTTEVVALPKLVSLSKLVQTLKTTTHNMFPVVVASSKRLIGTISRPNLVNLLMHTSRAGHMLSAEDLKRLNGRVDADYDRKLISK